MSVPQVVVTNPSDVSNGKRKADSDDILEIMPIGAGSEVGRSCIILKYKGKTVMLDCGVHPAYNGLSALPYFDMIDPSSIDVLLVSHFHLDHCAALPYFLQKTTFKGRVFMTHPSKAIYKMLLSDYVKVSNIAIEDMLYDEQDLLNSMEKIETINYHQEIEANGVTFWSYNAGHVLGAAMFMLEIAGVRILYTGDFSRQEDRHLKAAEIPHVAPHILIVESTYGVQIHEPRAEREHRFTSIVHDIVKRGGRCLIPVFALGRAQELLLILDEYWEAHPELSNVPIYYASTLAKRCMTVYQTYINMMNDKIQQQFAVANPFIFKHISNLKSMEHFQDTGPCVIMASPGMLQSGLSRELFELWCPDKRNGVIIPGYCVEGTLAKHIMSEPETVTAASGQILPLNLSVNYISFSAHSDFLQTSEFIDKLQPPYVVLVHGDSNEMGRLKQSLIQKYENKNIQVFSPKNGQTVQLQFRAEKLAKTIGKLAAKQPEDKMKVSGIIIEKDFNHNILDPSDLSTFTQLSTSIVSQRILIPYSLSFQTVLDSIQQMYDEVSEIPSKDKQTIQVCSAVTVIRNNPETIALEWNSDPVNDMIADSIISIIMQTKKFPQKVKPKTKVVEQQSSAIQSLLEKQFGNVAFDFKDNKIEINVDGAIAIIELQPTLKVECEDEQLQQNIESFLSKTLTAVLPIKSY